MSWIGSQLRRTSDGDHVAWIGISYVASRRVKSHLARNHHRLTGQISPERFERGLVVVTRNLV